jgi:peptidoglycan/xylan/chitin deacetylase (PgdA/CDA1 family)
MLAALLGATVGGAAVLAHGALAPNSSLFGPVIGRGPRQRALYLTFDDGPNPYTTEPIVRLLERERVPATFFMVGRHVERYPELARLVAGAGFGIGNHTQTHRRLALAGPGRVAWEVGAAHEAIETTTGTVATCFRAPHGYRNPCLRRVVARFRYRVFGWTFGVWDTDRPGATVIRERMRRGIRPGAVLLLHDGDGYDPEGDRRQTAEALPGIIKDCRASGYEFRSLQRLAADGNDNGETAEQSRHVGAEPTASPLTSSRPSSLPAAPAPR